jgi:hypothetical protein
VGDLFMSLIHTCQLCGANSFDYLVELQRHARELAARPAEWMPWNYRETLHPTDKDPSVGAPDLHPTDKNPSVGAPDLARPDAAEL